MIHMAIDAGGHKENLDPYTLFPGFSSVSVMTSMHERPSETLRFMRGLRKANCTLHQSFWISSKPPGYFIWPKIEISI